MTQADVWQARPGADSDRFAAAHRKQPVDDYEKLYGTDSIRVESSIVAQ